MWIIVVAMLTTGPMDDLYAFHGYPFPDKIMCIAFAKQNMELVTTIARQQYDGQEVENVYCVPQHKFDELVNGKAV